MAWEKTWTVTFRCYRCGRKFILRHLTFEKIEALHPVLPCPFCDARPVVQPVRLEAASKAHFLVGLSDEMETIYRKRRGENMWHCDPSCPQWPGADFIALDVAPGTGLLCNECVTKTSQLSY